MSVLSIILFKEKSPINVLSTDFNPLKISNYSLEKLIDSPFPDEPPDITVSERRQLWRFKLWERFEALPDKENFYAFLLDPLIAILFSVLLLYC